MSPRRMKIVIVVAVLAVTVAVAIAVRVGRKGVPRLNPAITLEGSVLKQDADPSKRTPIAGVVVTATRGETELTGETDPTGYFHVRFSGGIQTGADLTLTFVKAGYKT